MTTTKRAISPTPKPKPKPKPTPAKRGAAIVSTRRSQLLITQAAAACEAAEVKLHQRVHEARANGVTWEEVAEALGVTRQSAHRRFSSTAPQDGEA